MATPHRTPPPVPRPERGGDQADARPSGSAPEAPRGGPDAASDPGAVDEIVQELEDRLRWATADLENLRQRYDREVLRERVAARGRVAGEWLPVIDNLDLAIQHVDDAAGAASDAVIAGMRAIRDQGLAVLERLGFSRFDDVGELFEPSRHEAVSTVESDAPPNTIVATVRPGYGNGEEVLRPAAVIVSRSSGSPSAPTADPERSHDAGSLPREPA